jgi:2-succinyl-5-enolpyruvyl-6-hydroxy-3-cyclohexene-1-carboxylate synthase
VGAEPTPGTPRLETADVDALVDALAGVERGAIVAGSLRQGAAPVVELAGKLAWPLIAEPTSGLRVPGALSAGQFLLANEGFASQHAPEVALQIGAAPTSRAGLAFVATAEQLLVIDPDKLVADPARHASWTIAADPGSLVRSVLGRLDERAPSAWLEGWTQADAAVRSPVDGLIDRWDEPYEGRIARDLYAVIPDGGTLVVGSSMPVRDLDTYGLPRNSLRVLANRGASGIDGFVSTTLGVAASDASTYALMGDLTLLHDAGGLLWNARRGYDAVLVVLNNGGGTIFSFLAQRDLLELGELFTTPHGLDLAKLADAAGAGHTRVGRAVDLVPAVEKAANRGGVHIVEVAIDRELNVARHADVHSAVAAALTDIRW